MSTAKFDTLSDLAGTYTVPVATVAQGSAKAWVNFNGTGTVAIRASFNVSSITDNGTGDYTANFTTAMPDANYSVTGNAGLLSTRALLIGFGVNAVPTTTAARISSTTSNTAAPTDGDYVAVAIFR